MSKIIGKLKATKIKAPLKRALKFFNISRTGISVNRYHLNKLSKEAIPVITSTGKAIFFKTDPTSGRLTLVHTPTTKRIYFAEKEVVGDYKSLSGSREEFFRRFYSPAKCVTFSKAFKKILSHNKKFGKGSGLQPIRLRSSVIFVEKTTGKVIGIPNLGPVKVPYKFYNSEIRKQKGHR